MTTTRSGLATLALGVAVLATASGCGGSKGLSRSELIAKADPICRRANTAAESASGTDTQNPRILMQSLGRAAPRVAATDLQVSAELAKLTPPSSMAADWRVIVDGFRRAGTGWQKTGEALRTVSFKAKKPVMPKAFFQAEHQLSDGQNVRTITAGRYGFLDCAKL